MNFVRTDEKISMIINEFYAKIILYKNLYLQKCEELEICKIKLKNMCNNK